MHMISRQIWWIIRSYQLIQQKSRHFHFEVIYENTILFQSVFEIIWGGIKWIFYNLQHETHPPILNIC